MGEVAGRRESRGTGAQHQYVNAFVISCILTAARAAPLPLQSWARRALPALARRAAREHSRANRRRARECRAAPDRECDRVRRPCPARAPRGRRARHASAQRLRSKEPPAACRERRDRGTRAARASTRQLLREVFDELAGRDTVLLEGIAVAHGHRLVLRGLAVDRDPVRRARFILPAIAAAGP